MLIKNIDDTLVNGSLGRVRGFMDERSFEYRQDEEDGHEDGENGETADKDSESSQWSKSKQRMRAMSNGELIAETGRRWPLVRFAMVDGSTRDLLCQPESWKIELPNGEVQACRTQVPLILAWALSIHKAQGQTLERVKVDLGRIFEKGQAYVALSRATSQEGLQILRFDPRKVMAHEKVRQFYNNLYSVEQVGRNARPSKRKGNPAQPSEKNFTSGGADFDDDEEALLMMGG